MRAAPPPRHDSPSLDHTWKPRQRGLRNEGQAVHDTAGTVRRDASSQRPSRLGAAGVAGRGLLWLVVTPHRIAGPRSAGKAWAAGRARSRPDGASQASHGGRGSRHCKAGHGQSRRRRHGLPSQGTERLGVTTQARLGGASLVGGWLHTAALAARRGQDSAAIGWTAPSIAGAARQFRSAQGPTRRPKAAHRRHGGSRIGWLALAPPVSALQARLGTAGPGLASPRWAWQRRRRLAWLRVSWRFVAGTGTASHCSAG